MDTVPISTTPSDSQTLASHLVPLLSKACGDQLGTVTWFRTDWQRGGAATGRAKFESEDGAETEVIVKVPVVRRELLWTKRLQNSHDDESGVVPKLFACGESLEDYDLAWIVIEHFPHGPLALHWHDDHVPRMAAAAARFHASSAKYPIDQVPTSEPWDVLLESSTKSVKLNNVENRKRWATVLKQFRGISDRIVKEWNERDENTWLHGDLHLANAMCRTSIDQGPVSLIDLAEVHAGHWVEDAVYLERQFWPHAERLRAHRPVKAIAAARKECGLPVEDEYPRLAMIRRALLAATAPGFIKTEGHPAFLSACLDWLEIAMSELM